MSISSTRLHRPGNRPPGRWARAGMVGLLVVAAWLPAGGSPTSSAGSLIADAPYVPDRVIVAYETGTSGAEVLGLESEVGASFVKAIGPEARLLRVPRGAVPATVAALSADPHVHYAEPDYYLYPTSHGSTPNDAYFHEQWALDNTGQEYRANSFGTPGADIDARRAWDITTGNADVVVGVVDSGLDLDHPDLVGNLWSSPGLTVAGKTCGPTSRGYDAYDDDCVPEDVNGHGTSVGGVVGADGNNGAGVTGVAWNVSLMGLRVFPEPFLIFNDTQSSIVAEGVWWAVEAKKQGVNVRVLNMSIGGPYATDVMYSAIRDAGNEGILVVTAAGNDGRDVDAQPIAPCSFDLDNMICVAGTTSTDDLGPGSNWGATAVDLAAPAYDIRKLLRGGSYGYGAGTSLAAPHVAGAAALVFSEFPSLTPQQVKAKILNNVDPLHSLEGRVATGGRLNLYGALTGPIGETPTTTTPPTTVPPEGGSGGSGGGGSGRSGGSQTGGDPPGSGGGTGGGDPGGSGASSSSATVNGGQSPTAGAGGSAGAPGGTNPSRGSSGALPGGLWGSDVAVAGESVSKGAPPSGGARVTYDDDPSSRGSGWAVAVGTALAGMGLASVGLWRSRASRFGGRLAESVQLARPV